MNTRIYNTQNENELKKGVADAAKTLREGGLVIFPTETVYGIGGDATNDSAARKIYTAKGRPSDNPLIIHVAKPEDTERYAVTSPAFYRLAERFMPGPLTVILPRRESIPKSVTGGLETVAVRCPSHPVAHAMITVAGVPVAAPSANLSGQPSGTTAAHVIKDFSDRVDVILAGGAADFGLESTIVKLDGEHLTLLRPGAVTPEDLRTVLPELSIADAAVSGELGKNEHPLSPGMKYKHYAPRVPLTLLCGDEAAVRAFLQKEAAPGVGFLCYEEEKDNLPAELTLFPVGKKEDLAAQAHLLFAALRAADETPGLTRLYAHMPKTDGIGLALYNRAIRAAAHTVLHL